MTTRRTRLLFLGLAALASVGTAALADPVEVTEGSESSRVTFVCSVWVEPSGQQYEWTFVCGEITDTDGDGAVDSRRGIVFRDICEESDPRRGSWCFGGNTIAEADVAPEELSIDVNDGTASLHALLGSCRIDVDWTGASDVRQQHSSEIPDVWPGLFPPSVSLLLEERDYDMTDRDAAFSGTVCPQAEVSGPPHDGIMIDYVSNSRRTTVTVDPTA